MTCNPLWEGRHKKIVTLKVAVLLIWDLSFYSIYFNSSTSSADSFSRWKSHYRKDSFKDNRFKDGAWKLNVVKSLFSHCSCFWFCNGLGGLRHLPNYAVALERQGLCFRFKNRPRYCPFIANSCGPFPCVHESFASCNGISAQIQFQFLMYFHYIQKALFSQSYPSIKTYFPLSRWKRMGDQFGNVVKSNKIQWANLSESSKVRSLFGCSP